MAKKFFYVCAGIFLLALAYHFGARSATAQAPGNPIVAVSDPWFVLANGDTYRIDSGTGRWQFIGNMFVNSGPTPAKQKSWGQLKTRYR